MKIFINDIRIYAYHGVLPQERVVGGWFLVSIEVESKEESATRTDDLADTMNYASIADIVREEMAQPSQLLEHVAGRIARRLLNELPKLTHVGVSVTKENPPIPGLQCSGAGVKVEI